MVVVAVFFTGTYLIFHRVFSYLFCVQDIGILLIDRLIGIGFLAFFLMLIISNLISSTGTLYRSDETTFLMSSPMEYRQVFWVKFVDNIFYASWATLIITIPLFVAYGEVHGFAWYYYLVFAVLALFPFLIIPAVIGSGFSLLIFPLAHKFGLRRVLILLGAVAVVAVFFMMRARFSRILFSAQGDLALLNYYLQDIATNENPWLPNVWIVEALRGARLGKPDTLWFHLSMLLSTAAAALVLIDVFAKRFYYKAYIAATEVLVKKRRKTEKTGLYGTVWNIFAPFPKDMRSLFVKDVKVFLRDPNQWSQFTILLVLIVFYLINLRHVPINVEGLYWRTLISFVNFAFCGYILATLSVRFVYPAISMEGPSFWAISSSPISVKRLFWEKFWIAFLIFFVLAEIVAVVSNGLLAQSVTMTLLTGAGILMMSISLTALGTGLGSVFPSFEEPNPGKIASSGGGMICALVSLIYVALSTISLAYPTHNYMSYLIGQRETFPTTEIAVGTGALIIINLAATLIPLKLGLKAIDKLEF